MKLKRRLCFKNHQLFQTVFWLKLRRALHKLKEIRLQYDDVIIRNEAHLCDPTLHDNKDVDIDEDQQIHDSDFNEDDLMEI